MLFTISQEKRDFQDQYHSGWAHNGGLPLELWWDEGVRFAPVRELAGCRGKKLLELSAASPGHAAEALAGFSGNRFLLKIRAKAGLLVLGIVNDREKRSVFYDRDNGRLGVLGADGK